MKCFTGKVSLCANMDGWLDECKRAFTNISPIRISKSKYVCVPVYICIDVKKKIFPIQKKNRKKKEKLTTIRERKESEYI